MFSSKITLCVLKNSILLQLLAVIHNFVFMSFVLKWPGKYKLVKRGVFFRDTRFLVRGPDNEIMIRPENRLKRSELIIKGKGNRISIGPHCILNNTELWIEDDNGVIDIGDKTTIEGAHIAATEGKKIIIGKDCMFSSGIQIRNGDSHSIVDLNTGERINEAQDIIIGNHVWIGSDVKILKGARIADNAVIGSGSIVTGEIEENSVYAGIPAQKIRSNIQWNRRRDKN